MRKVRRGMNPDARAAIAAARKGNCKAAFRHLHDALPYNQTRDPIRAEQARKDHITASVIYDRLCTRGRDKHPAPLSGTQRRRRRRSRR